MTMNRLAQLALLCISLLLPSASAQVGPDVWMLTLLGKNDNDGNCQANAEDIGQQVQQLFDDAIPGISAFDPATDPAFNTPTTNNRFLRSDSNSAVAEITRRRELAVNLCNRGFCSRPRNWDVCLWNGCNCNCGDRRRDLQVTSNASDMALVLAAKRSLDKWVRQKGVELGCELGLIMEKMRG